MGVFSEFKPKNSARKNPFDLSCFSTYNTKVGLALPLKFWPTLPSSEYELDLKCLLRTQPLQTAAFAGFSVNYDVVWTPNNDHYSSFNQFIAQRLNKQHTTQPDINEIPHFDLGWFQKIVLAGAVVDSFCADMTRDVWQKLHDEQGLQYSLPYFLASSVHLPEESMFISAIRTLDLLEYGNILPFLKYYKGAIKAWIDTWTFEDSHDVYLPYYVKLMAYLDSSSNLVSYDSASHKWLCDTIPAEWTFSVTMESCVSNAYDLLFASSSPLYTLSNKFDGGKFYSLWPVFCYNKAFWQFYRNEYYDIQFDFTISNGTGGRDLKHFDYVQLFNYDDFSVGVIPSPSDEDSYLRLLSMFCVKPHQYKKDLFTGVLPSTQYGSVSVASADDVFAKLIGNVGTESLPTDAGNRRVFTGSNVNLTTSEVLATKFITEYDPVAKSDKFKFDPAPMINVLELRRADAMQRFKERMLRAGNKTKDIFVAHGWDEPLSEKAFDVQFFGNFDGRLDLNVVASTTDTESVNLGQLAANGTAIVNGSKVHFKCKDFGTLLVIAYITKDAVYDSYGVHKSHAMLESWDFPYPELQNVSLAPIVESQLNNFGLNKVSSVLGFEPQNMAYKTQNDLVHGEFFSAPIADIATLNMDKFPVFVGKYANMVTPRLDINSAKALSFLYIQPSCADNIFVESANSNQDTDPIFGNVRFDLKATQPLDVIGLPI